MSLQIVLLPSVHQIPATDWAQLHTAGNPFLDRRWLVALEDSGALDAQSGWAPQFVRLTEGEQLLGVLPMYRKTNSQGEFVYDWAWADVSQRMGIPYYPKWVVTSPFSPVAGPRFLWTDAVAASDRLSLATAVFRGLAQAGTEVGIRGVHVLFCTEAESLIAAESGGIARTSHQYHWQNQSYASFDAWMGSLRGKRRKNIARERRLVHEAGYTVRAVPGTEWTAEHVDLLYQFYATTCARYMWGRQYLPETFFARVHATMPEHLLAFFAYDPDDQIVAGTFNVLGGNRLYGRYWGALRDVPLLHFETCYYAMIEYAIAHGIDAIEPGAGGEHKYARGFDPVVTHSIHRVAHPALHRLLDRHVERERQMVDEEVEAMREQGAYRRG